MMLRADPSCLLEIMAATAAKSWPFAPAMVVVIELEGENAAGYVMLAVVACFQERCLPGECSFEGRTWPLARILPGCCRLFGG